MPDKATIAAPRWVAHGPEPTSKPAKVDLKKSYTNSEPTSIIQHQLTTENGFFFKPHFKVVLCSAEHSCGSLQQGLI